MYFKKGDCFEVSGKERWKVIYAEEEFCIIAALRHNFLEQEKPFLSSAVKMIPNREENFEDKYWIRRIPEVDTMLPDISSLMP